MLANGHNVRIMCFIERIDAHTLLGWRFLTQKKSNDYIHKVTRVKSYRCNRP
jgi:hypothetical protein